MLTLNECYIISKAILMDILKKGKWACTIKYLLIWYHYFSHNNEFYFNLLMCTCTSSFCLSFLPSFHSFSIIFLLFSYICKHPYVHTNRNLKNHILNISLCYAWLIICHSGAPGNYLRLMKVLCFFWKVLIVSSRDHASLANPTKLIRHDTSKNLHWVWYLDKPMTGGLKLSHTHSGSLAHTQCRQRLRRLKWCIRELDAERCIIYSPHCQWLPSCLKQHQQRLGPPHPSASIPAI